MADMKRKKAKSKEWGIAMAKKMFQAHRVLELMALNVCTQNIYPQSEVNECDYTYSAKNY